MSSGTYRGIDWELVRESFFGFFEWGSDILGILSDCGVSPARGAVPDLKTSVSQTQWSSVLLIIIIIWELRRSQTSKYKKGKNDQISRSRDGSICVLLGLVWVVQWFANFVGFCGAFYPLERRQQKLSGQINEKLWERQEVSYMLIVLQVPEISVWWTFTVTCLLPH